LIALFDWEPEARTSPLLLHGIEGLGVLALLLHCTESRDKDIPASRVCKQAGFHIKADDGDEAITEQQVLALSPSEQISNFFLVWYV